jgi:hypothetical protein
VHYCHIMSFSLNQHLCILLDILIHKHPDFMVTPGHLWVFTLHYISEDILATLSVPSLTIQYVICVL